MSLFAAHPVIGQAMRQQQGGGLSPQSLFGVNTPFGSLNILGASPQAGALSPQASSVMSATSSSTRRRPSCRSS